MLLAASALADEALEQMLFGNPQKVIEPFAHEGKHLGIG